MDELQRQHVSLAKQLISRGADLLGAVAGDRPDGSTADTDGQVDAHANFPSREASEESVQINMRLTVETAERFKALCKADRRTYGGMIEILLDHFEGRGGGGA